VRGSGGFQPASSGREDKSGLEAPAPYPGVTAALAELTRRVAAQLADNLVGVYLQGSFALGDFTQSSDVDVLVVIERDLDEHRIEPLQTLHGSLFETLPAPWGQRIELSYAPLPLLRRWSATPRDPPGAPRAADWTDPTTGAAPKAYPFWYLNNGARELVRSEHDNTRVVRWVTREKGVALVGPDPKSLIDPVSPGDLRAEIADTLALVAAGYPTPEAIGAAWLQAFFVTLCCRALYTLETGAIASKKAATQWAAAHLEPRWRPLVETAWTRWRDSRASLGGPPDPDAVRQTLALIAYALGEAQAR
jgi:predicted nucleotidyltransferase